jgi:hypothetical protein
MMKNCRDESFAFRQFYIAHLLAIDIQKRLEPIERAVESYIEWVELVKRRRPLFTLYGESESKGCPHTRRAWPQRGSN